MYWRKEWDSNPRWSCPHGGFQDRCLKPLGHPSFASPSPACGRGRAVIGRSEATKQSMLPCAALWRWIAHMGNVFVKGDFPAAVASFGA